MRKSFFFFVYLFNVVGLSCLLVFASPLDLQLRTS